MTQSKISVCQYCQKEFLPRNNCKSYKAKFCGYKCAGLWQSKYRSGKRANRWKGGGVNKKCLRCGKKFYLTLSKKTHKFCSQECVWLNSRGKKRPHSEATKKKIGLANSRKVLVQCETCGKIIKRSPSAVLKRIFCSKKCIDYSWLKLSLKKFRKIQSKETHWNWKGGINPINDTIRKSLKYKLWREAVFKRDNFTCVWCGVRAGNGKAVILNADHIKPFSLFPELRFAIDNGRTLCESCHKKTDTFAGKIKKLNVKTK